MKCVKTVLICVAAILGAVCKPFSDYLQRTEKTPASTKTKYQNENKIQKQQKASVNCATQFGGQKIQT